MTLKHLQQEEARIRVQLKALPLHDPRRAQLLDEFQAVRATKTQVRDALLGLPTINF